MIYLFTYQNRTKKAPILIIDKVINASSQLWWSSDGT